MKKIFFAIAFTFTFLISAFSTPKDQLKQYVLENGLQLYFLEDSSDALIHIEYVVKAGFSSQTQETNGFFKLYTNLIKNTFSQLDTAECNSDFSSYKITVSQGQLEEILYDFSNVVFNLQFSDEALLQELSALKIQSEETGKSAAGFINAAIDSRVFSGAPWQHDSGIYPPLFKKTSPKDARIILTSILQKWYTPQNSALFISGNFNSEHLLTQIKNSFGRFYSSYPVPASKNSAPVNNKRRYVLHNPEFSKELTQVVIQYTTLNQEQSEVLAAALNFPNSSLKAQLLQSSSLNIPGDEYINVAAAHKKQNSRVIIQSLLQQPAKPAEAAKITSCKQSLEFLNDVQSIQKLLSPVEMQTAKLQLLFNFSEVTANPHTFMESLAQYWAMEQYSSVLPYDSFSPLQTFLNHNQLISDVDMSQVLTSLNSEEPFVFVLISDEDYKKSKAEYKAAGFTEVTASNASWYVQKMYEEIKNQLKPDDSPVFNTELSAADNDYFNRNITQIKNFTLDNGIPLSVKKNQNSSNLNFTISIKGGQLNSAENPGFEEVMVNLIASMIQKEIYQKQAQGIILSSVNVTSQSGLTASTISINCQKDDFSSVCQSAAHAIIFGEIPPSSADRAVSSRQYKKRLENGSSVRQLYAAAASTLYPSSALSKITSTSGDILQSTDYNSILQAYPAFLNASRYTLLLTGDFDDSAVDIIKKDFSQLTDTKKSIQTPVLTQKFPSNKWIEIKVKHTFLTDIPAEKAGPMPAVLIPTTEFLDPVIYCIKAPAAGTKEAAVFNAVLNYVEAILQKNLSQPEENAKNTTAYVQLPQGSLEAGFVIFQNVKHTKDIENLYRQTLETISRQLTMPNAKNDVIARIKNQWTKTQLAQTSSNEGTAQLMEKGLELFSSSKEPQTDFYLKEYNTIQNAAAQDFIEIMKCFPLKADLRVFSADSPL